MKIKIYFLLMLCVLFWSSNFILGRYVHNEFEPITLAFYRWLCVFILMFPFFIIHFKPLIIACKQHFVYLAVLSFFSVVCFNTLLYFGLELTTATNALLINSVFPILVVLLSFVILKSVITFNQILGIVFSTFGVVFIVLKGTLNNISHLDLNSGDIFILSATLTWALYSVLLKYKSLPLNAIQFFTLMVVMGFLIMLPLYLFSTHSIEKDLINVQQNGEIILYMAIFPSILSFLFWNKGILEIGADKTGQFTHLMPIFGTLLAYFFLGETIELYHFVGLLFIFLGIYLSQFLKCNCF